MFRNVPLKPNKIVYYSYETFDGLQEDFSDAMIICSLGKKSVGEKKKKIQNHFMIAETKQVMNLPGCNKSPDVRCAWPRWPYHHIHPDLPHLPHPTPVSAG